MAVVRCTSGQIRLGLRAQSTVGGYGGVWRLVSRPRGWPEVLSQDFVAKLDPEEHLGIDKDNVPTSLDPYFHPIEVPKSYLGVRPAVVQDPISRLVYNAAVLNGAEQLHSELPEWVYGWRLRNGAVAKNKPEWSAYVESLPGVDDGGFGLVTDITSFFASIQPSRLYDIVGSSAGKTIPRRIIETVINAHGKMLGRSGLPQRSFASAILANSYLQPIDDALGAAFASWDLDIIAVRRWMDDISAEGPEEALYGLLLELQDRARQIGLELNSAKTQMSDASETAAELRSETLKEIEVEFFRMKRSEYSDEEIDVAVDADVLRGVEDEILRSPHDFGRPTIRAVLHSLRKYELFDRSSEWRSIAQRIPHVADTMGRYLRGAMDASFFDPEVTNCVNWFNDYAGSAWGRQTWVTSQFALAFDENTSHRIREVLERWLESSGDLQQVAIAVERMTAMDPTFARDVMRSRADRTSDPLLLRVFALGLLQAKSDRGTVTAVLDRDRRNRLLKHYLDTKNWEPPSVVADFSGSDDDQGVGTADA